ncbi:hypothetical protein GN956_G18665 [Arapaima gigas]
MFCQRLRNPFCVTPAQLRCYEENPKTLRPRAGNCVWRMSPTDSPEKLRKGKGAQLHYNWPAVLHLRFLLLKTYELQLERCLAELPIQALRYQTMTWWVYDNKNGPRRNCKISHSGW